MTTKKNNGAQPAAAATDPLAAVLTQGQAAGDAQGFGPEATPDERARVNNRIRGCSMDLIGRMASLVTKSNGSVAGVSFNAAGATTTVARYKNVMEYASGLRLLAQQAEDTVSSELADLSDQTMTVMAAMKRSRNTPAGKGLQSTYKAFRKLVPASKGTRGAATAPTPVATPAPAVAATPVAAPVAAATPATHPASGTNGSGSPGA